MRKAILTAFLFSSLSTTAFPQIPDSHAEWLLTPEIMRGFDYALSAAKLTYKDFTFRPDYWEIDSARLNEVNQFTSSPLMLPHRVLETGQIARDRKSFRFVYFALHRISRLYNLDLLNKTIISAENVDQKGLRSIRRPNTFPTSRWLPYSDGFKENFFNLLANLPEKERLTGYDTKEIHFIQNDFPKAILEDTAEERFSVDELDSIQKLEEMLTHAFTRLVEKPRYKDMDLYITASFFRSLTGAENLIASATPYINRTPQEVFWKNEKQRVIIGGSGPNHYKGDYALIIDLGGDDTYELTRRPNFTGQVIIDLGGNDKYFALEDYALACGYFGYSVLIDAAGDDWYQGKNFSVGCGFFGCGLLWDQAGNDTYIGDQFTQGAGGFGIGVLKDGGGNDRYQAARLSQGFGFVRGVGALLDAGGNDNYFAGGKYKELIGLSGEIRYLSESQGYAMGLRPELSGGMGFLFDYDGDDSYNIDMNGQGASYWWGLGALVDFKGNDRYIAQQYAQGAGVHMSLGVLVDSSGNDFYFSKGVSQGCGHDLGAGMLFDLYGNDNYVATDGSQAYGSANGFGILTDGAGNDGYYVKDTTNTQGVGNPRREYGSIAVFLDCGGADHYDGNGGENRIWKPTGTNWGVGVDGNFGSTDSLRVKK